MNKVLLAVGAIILLIIGAAGGFYGGITYAKGQTQDAAGAFLQQRGGANGSQTAQGQQGPCGFVRTGAGGFNRGGAGTGGSGGTGGAGGNGGQAGANFAQNIGNCVARGQVKSVDPGTNTMQVSTPVNVVTVKLSDKTIISKTDQGSISDLKPGERVTVFSTETGDSPTASAVQLQNGASLFGGQ